jgi:Icc-related predicted phosphoesterase
MSRTKKNAKLVEDIFKPDSVTGFSVWKTRETIDTTKLALGNNGNIRQNTPWTDKYIWEIKRQNDKETTAPICFRTIGFSKNTIPLHPMPSKNTRDELLADNPTCVHCGNHKTLCLDHKNDTYKDLRVLDKSTLRREDFQVLCNKCNKDLKHQVNVKEKKSGKLHTVKGIGLNEFKYDSFEYPWEKCLTQYDETNIYCKKYTYWYDIEEFRRKREIFKMYTRPINSIIKHNVKLIQ